MRNAIHDFLTICAVQDRAQARLGLRKILEIYEQANRTPEMLQTIFETDVLDLSHACNAKYSECIKARKEGRAQDGKAYEAVAELIYSHLLELVQSANDMGIRLSPKFLRLYGNEQIDLTEHMTLRDLEGDTLRVFIQDIAEMKTAADDTNELPRELDTDRARKYFARAVELGYMERTDTGYKWLFGGNRGLARLGYFVLKIYCPTNTEQLPESAINNLFGVNRIASAITQLHNAKKPQKWRPDIDKIFAD